MTPILTLTIVIFAAGVFLLYGGAALALSGRPHGRRDGGGLMVAGAAVIAILMAGMA